MRRLPPLLCLLCLLSACALASADTGAKEGDGSDGGDGGAASLSLSTTSGATGSLTDSGQADGPGFTTATGALDHGILTIQNSAGDFFDLSLLGGEAGIEAGAVCRPFVQQSESVGCGWFAGGAADFPLDDGTRYDPLAWQEVDGELTITQVEPEGDGLSIDLSGWLTLAQTADEARIELSITGGHLGL